MLSKRIRVILIALFLCCFSVIPVFGQAQETPPPATDINGLQVTFDVDPSYGLFDLDDLRAAAEVIAHRLEALDISPYRVQIVNQSAIQVQFPGVNDPQSVIDTLTQTARLEF